MVDLLCNPDVFTTEILNRITLMEKVIKNGLMERHILVNTKWDKKRDMVYTNGPEANDMKDIGKRT